MDLNLKNLNLDVLAKLPTQQKVLALVVVVLLMVGGYLYLGYFPRRDQLRKQQAELSRVQAEVRQHQAMVEQLSKVKQEVERLNAKLTDALARLPQSADIPSLLVNITNLGKESSVEFLSFQPKGEVPKNFYAEVPIDIALTANYHDLATFLDKLARMPRIVNVSNLTLGDAKPAGGKTSVKVSLTATTYRFTEKIGSPQNAKH